MENKKNHQIWLLRARIGFSCLDVLDRKETKNHIQSPYEIANAIIATDQQYND